MRAGVCPRRPVPVRAVPLAGTGRRATDLRYLGIPGQRQYAAGEPADRADGLPVPGPERTVADVEDARRSLEELFRDSGYGTVVVNIPEQDVIDGLVRLDIVEGTVDRVLVTGARYFSPEQIKARTPALAQGEVPYLPQVQQELTTLNAASRDRRITPILRPGRREGTVEVDLQVEDNATAAR